MYDSRRWLHHLESTLLTLWDAAAAKTRAQGGTILMDRSLTSLTWDAKAALWIVTAGRGDGEVETGVDALENGVTRERRRHEDHGGIAAGLFPGLIDGVEDGDGVVKFLSAFARGDAGNDVRAIIAAAAGVKGAGISGDALNQKTGVFIYENAHEGGTGGMVRPAGKCGIPPARAAVFHCPA